jgi:hypothetical protein
MPTIGDLVKITSCSNILSQDACNVFYYLVAAWTGNLTILEALEQWQEQVATPIAGQLAQDLDIGELSWNNVDSPAESGSISGGFYGTAAEGPVSAFTAVSVRLFGTTAVTRSGWKRIAGVVESSVASGVISPTVLAIFQDWADESIVIPLTAPLSGTPDMVLIPVVVGRNTDGSLNTAAVNPLASAVVQNLMTTQNTRKVGRGS